MKEKGEREREREREREEKKRGICIKFVTTEQRKCGKRESVVIIEYREYEREW
jgi:hypothetical protein